MAYSTPPLPLLIFEVMQMRIGLGVQILGDLPLGSVCSWAHLLYHRNVKSSLQSPNLLLKLSTDPCLLLVVRWFGFGDSFVNLVCSSVVPHHSMPIILVLYKLPIILSFTSASSTSKLTVILLDSMSSQELYSFLMSLLEISWLISSQKLCPGLVMIFLLPNWCYVPININLRGSVEVGHMTQVFLAHPDKAHSIISQREYIFQRGS